MKHIKRDFSLMVRVRSPGWIKEVWLMPNIIFLRNMVTLHIQLKGMKHIIAC